MKRTWIITPDGDLICPICGTVVAGPDQHAPDQCSTCEFVNGMDIESISTDLAKEYADIIRRYLEETD